MYLASSTKIQLKIYTLRLSPVLGDFSFFTPLAKLVNAIDLKFIPFQKVLGSSPRRGIYISKKLLF